jgi:3-phosphoglycerate kinase
MAHSFIGGDGFLEALWNLTLGPSGCDASTRPVCGFQRKAKVADKTQHTMNWLVYADNMIIGNGRTSTLLKSDGGKIGASMLE